MSDLSAIAGRKGGSDSPHIPTEASDSLRSKASVHILDLISEGEIEGLINGAQSVFLDDTPLQNADGTFNFTGVTLDVRNGTQAQSYITGFPAVENEVSVNVKVTTASPVIRHITTQNLNAARVRVLVPSLRYQDLTNGDTSGTTVQYAIDVQNNGGGYVPVLAGVGWSTGSTVTSPTQQQTTASATRIRGTLSATSNASPTVLTIEWKKTTDVSWTSGAVIDCSGKQAWGQPLNKQFTGSVTFASGGTNLKPVGFTTPDLPAGLYDVRVRIVSGPATSTLTGVEIYTAVETLTISGKSSGPYQRSHRISLPAGGPWDIRVRRLTADNALSNVANDIFFDTYTEVIDAKLRYPNSAVAGIQCDASQFSSVPTRSYHAKLLRVKIPSNYNPLTRVYTGVWDGLFTVAWTDNPAWCYYDLVTNPRYGLGEFISAAQVDKWSLYTIGQYCDEMVDDGFGGTEPRFTMNVYLQTREDAYKVLNDLASCFRGMQYFSNGVTVVQDSPADPVYLYTPANVIDGMFNYSGSARAARHTVALVAWNDPSDFYRQKVEYVEDLAGIALYGVVEAEVSTVGCTSRGQAQRAGRWLLYSERLLTDTVTFQVGLDGTVARPGQAIKIADPAKATVRLGGRLVSGTTTVLGLDAPVTLAPSFTYTASVMLADGTVESRTVTTGSGTVSSVTVGSAFSAAPLPGAVWVLESNQVKALTYRVLVATESAKNIYSLVALLHNEGIYDAIENGLVLEPVNGTLTIPLPIAPSVVTIDSSYYAEAGTSKIRMSVSWDRSSTVSVYRVSYRRAENNWVTLPDTGQSFIEINDVPPDTYSVEVVAFDAAGRRSKSTFGSGVVDGKGTAPEDVTDFSAQQSGAVVLFQWHEVSDNDLSGYEIRYVTLGSGLTWVDALPISKTTKGTTITTAKVPPGSWTFFIAAIDATKNPSVNPASADLLVTNQFDLIAVDSEAPAWAGTMVGFVKHWTGVIFPDSLDAASLNTWDTFDIFVPNPVAICTYESAEVDGTNDSLQRAWGNVEARLGPNCTGFPDPSQELKSRTSAGSYGAYAPWSIGSLAARYVKMRITTDTAVGIPVISLFDITLDAEERSEGAFNVTVSNTGLAIVFDQPFKKQPTIKMSVKSATSLLPTYTGESVTGFTLHIFNPATGAEVGGTASWQVDGV